MARTIIDWLIKGTALAVVAVFVFCYWQQKDNGRYIYHAETQSIVVIDTRTGTLYSLVDAKWVEMHPQTGTVVPRNPRLP
jgi:hypothetical protein